MPAQVVNGHSTPIIVPHARAARRA
jgi:hypothetical protein